MRLLTVHQPWADLIVGGLKRYENRSWPTAYRGPVAIHAGKSRKSLAKLPDVLRVLAAAGQDYEGPWEFGSVLGVANLTACDNQVPAADFASGPFCWEFSQPLILPHPIPWKGALGLVKCPEELQAEIRLQLGSDLGSR